VQVRPGHEIQFDWIASLTGLLWKACKRRAETLLFESFFVKFVSDIRDVQRRCKVIGRRRYEIAMIVLGNDSAIEWKWKWQSRLFYVWNTTGGTYAE
jgi:hypothetical protein